MTQHHSLEPQVHRQNRGWIEGIAQVSLSLSLLSLRHLKAEQSTHEKKKSLQKQRAFSETTLIPESNYWLKGFVSLITALYCPCWTSQVAQW